MKITDAKKLSYTINTVILLIVICMMGLFKIEQATIMVYFSIPTIGVYLINYGLIAKEKLDVFVWFTNIWIIIYMNIATICLGLDYGFHLYSMSLIPVAFCTEYMSYKLNTRNVKAVEISVLIALCDLIVTGMVLRMGSIYPTKSEVMRSVMQTVNTLTVLSFLIAYSHILIKMIMNSEENLKDMAHKDKLTGLFNRHYTMDELSRTVEHSGNNKWIAMIDIDNFKKFNDTYGHDCGDYVLVHLSELMKSYCQECVVSRWGGEEFLIVANNVSTPISILQDLRKGVASEQFQYNGTALSVTITIGAVEYLEGMNIDQWIQEADKKLYIGKTSGKNQVVI